VASTWGVSKFTAYVENIRLRKVRGAKWSLDVACLVCRASLLETVRLMSDAASMVFAIGSDKQKRDCPKVCTPETK
jgi:hypothetical protein